MLTERGLLLVWVLVGPISSVGGKGDLPRSRFSTLVNSQSVLHTSREEQRHGDGAGNVACFKMRTNEGLQDGGEGAIWE